MVGRILGIKYNLGDFFNSFLQLFRKCLIIVFGFEIPTIGCIFKFVTPSAQQNVNRECSKYCSIAIFPSHMFCRIVDSYFPIPPHPFSTTYVITPFPYLSSPLKFLVVTENNCIVSIDRYLNEKYVN